MKEKLIQWDLEIRQGRSGQVRKEIEALIRERRKKPIVRDDLAQVAAIARRCGAFELSIRLLHPIIRPAARKMIRATDMERLEYGAALVQIGADREGRELLSQLDGALVPQALLFSAFAHFQRWEYAESLPLLERYIQHPKIQDYTLLIGKVNYLSALVAVKKYDQAQAMFEDVARRLKEAGNHLLYANLLGIWVQKYIDEKDWARGEECIDSSIALQNVIGDLPVLYARKWRAVLQLTRNTGSKSALESLLQVQKEARALKNWETVRDCDFHRGRLLNDEKLLEFVYFGTPHASFRNRIDQMLGSRFQDQKTYLWRIQQGESASRFDLSQGRWEDSRKKGSLKSGQVSHRLLQLLGSDFYRSFKLDSMHGEIFPDRFYSPLASPIVMHQSIRRLRVWLQTNKVPLAIVEDAHRYSLQALAPLQLRVHLPSEPETRALQFGLDLRVSKRLGEYFFRFHGEPKSKGPFTRSDFAQSLGLSERSAGRYLEQALRAQLIDQVGRGPMSKYILKKNRPTH
jgi:hypothetical protein